MFRAAVGFVSSQAKMAKKTRKMLPKSEIEARVPRGGGGDSTYESGGDARRLA